jgi:hypothetical protein
MSLKDAMVFNHIGIEQKTLQDMFMMIGYQTVVALICEQCQDEQAGIDPKG